MGYMKHDAIIVTTYNQDKLAEALAVAEMLDLPCTDMAVGIINGQYSFMVAPDGSKEGWPESDKMDEQRIKFTEWVNEQSFEDGSNSLEFLAIRFGGDDTAITVEQL